MFPPFANPAKLMQPPNSKELNSWFSDANILIRAVLGSQVLALLITYSEGVDFFAPDTAFAEAYEHLPSILSKRKIDPHWR